MSMVPLEERCLASDLIRFVIKADTTMVTVVYNAKDGKAIDGHIRVVSIIAANPSFPFWTRQKALSNLFA